MKKMLCLAVIATAFLSAPAFAKPQGLGLNGTVATGNGGILGLLTRSNSGIGINATVATGKGGILGAVLGKGGLLGGGHGGCGCGY